MSSFLAVVCGIAAILACAYLLYVILRPERF
jgi:K+-transporting ATPase KdpF subunit